MKWKLLAGSLVVVCLLVGVNSLFPHLQYYALTNPRLDQDLPWNFQFRLLESGFKYSLAHYVAPYVVDDNEPRPYFVRFLCDNNESIRFGGDRAVTFRAEGKVLYIAMVVASAPGGRVAAYSLRDGRQLWEARLEAIDMESMEYSMYRSRVTLDLTPRTVIITGTESYGDYIEILDRRTGEQLAHKVYREGYQPRKPGDSPFLPE